MKIAKIIVCLITLNLVYVLNAGGPHNGFTVTCSGVTTIKPDSGKPQYRIKLTEKGENCTRVSGGPITEISEIVKPGASFTSIGKSFVTPSEGYFSYTVTSYILSGDTGENVVAGPYIVLQVTPETVSTDSEGIKWDLKFPTNGTKVLTISAIAEAIDLTK